MSTAGTGVHFARELRDICGVEHVVEDPAQLQGCQVLDVTPALAVSPATAGEVAAVLRLANQHGLSVVPAGGLARQRTGNVPAKIDILLRMSRLDQVGHYDAGDLTVGVGAGCSVAKLSSMVAADQLLFAADPAFPEYATVGGLLATGISGPLRHGYGGLRDYCIGIHFVTGDGRQGKGGGRVVKNVAGYDLMKLLIGSWGTLAVITGASFKLFPAPRQTRSFVAEFATAAEAFRYRDLVLHSPLSPICLELVSPEAQSLLPPDETAHPHWLLCIRAAGSDAVLARYRAELGSAISREIDGEEDRGFWRAVADFPYHLSSRYFRSLVISLSLPLRDVEHVLAYSMEVARSRRLRTSVIGRIGSGHLLIGFWSEISSPADPVAAVSALRDQLPANASLLVVGCWRGLQNQLPALERTPTHMESMRGVKRALDPNNVLNRGRFFV